MRGGLGMRSGGRPDRRVIEGANPRPKWEDGDPAVPAGAGGWGSGSLKINAAVVSRSKGNNARPTMSARTKGVKHYDQRMPTAVVPRSDGCGDRPTIPARARGTDGHNRVMPTSTVSRTKESVRDQQNPPRELGNRHFFSENRKFSEKISEKSQNSEKI